MISAVVSLFACSTPAPDELSACTPGAKDACYAQGKHALQGHSPQFDLSKAAENLEMACSAGHVDACLDFGLLVQEGRGVEQDYPRALALYQRICDGGSGFGCLNLGLMVRMGNGLPADEPRAHQLFQRSLDLFRDQCEGDGPLSCAGLGYVLESGFGITLPDPTAAAAAYARGCAAGDAEACLGAARIALEQGSSEQDRELVRLDEACLSSARACGVLGQVYWAGRYGVPKDTTRALGLMQRGCDRGDGQSCLMRAVLLSMGEEIEVREVESEEGAERACWLGKADGCMLAAKYSLGRYAQSQMPEDAHRTAARLSTACRIGHAAACRAFGSFVLDGSLGSPDRAVALAAFTEACRRLDFEACGKLMELSAPLPLVEPALSDFLAGACQRGIQAACVSSFTRDPGVNQRENVPSP